MGKIVILNIVEGSVENGYIVTLRIETEGDRRWIGNAKGKLPPHPEIFKQYRDWQSPYRARVDPMRSNARISASKHPNISISEIKKASKQLESSVNEWLESVEMREIKDALRSHLTDKSEEIRFIIQTEESRLQQLPWHSWRIFKKDYVNTEVGLYLPVEKQIRASPRDKVKVLAVFGKQEAVGSNTQIRIEQDWEMLERHLSQETNAELLRLDEPTVDKLGDLIEEQSPQILFFAGHSSTEEDEAVGLIELNQDESITIEDLAPDLREAVDRGLQLAIFNSCEGLGIARQLADFHIPNIIVMREPVPDDVAHKFLQRFLEAFAAGKPLHIAVRKAREKINHLEKKYPGATWLPMLFQNPAEAPLTWQGLGGVEVQRQSYLAEQPDGGPLTRIQQSESRSQNQYLKYLRRESLLKKRYQIFEFKEINEVWLTYIAKDTENANSDRVVVKQYKPNYNAQSGLTETDIIRRFNEELKSLSDKLGKLRNNSQIEKIIDYFEENRELYLVVNVIESEKSESLFKENEDDVIDFLQEVLELLNLLHGENIIHGDIHPSSLIRRKEDGKLVLINFGVVKHLCSQMVSSYDGDIVDNSHQNPYAPPEQKKGNLQLNSDIYSLGLIAIEELRKKALHELQGNQDDIRSYLNDAGVSDELANILDKMIESDYRKRYQSPEQVLNALESLTKPKFKLMSPRTLAIGAVIVLTGLAFTPILKEHISNLKEQISKPELPGQERQKLDVPATP